jgi:hypothetical protein
MISTIKAVKAWRNNAKDAARHLLPPISRKRIVKIVQKNIE